MGDRRKHYGSRQSACPCFRRYGLDGEFTQALQRIHARADAASGTDQASRRCRIHPGLSQGS